MTDAKNTDGVAIAREDGWYWADYGNHGRVVLEVIDGEPFFGDAAANPGHIAWGERVPEPGSTEIWIAFDKLQSEICRDVDGSVRSWVSLKDAQAFVLQTDSRVACRVPIPATTQEPISRRSRLELPKWSDVEDALHAMGDDPDGVIAQAAAAIKHWRAVPPEERVKHFRPPEDADQAMLDFGARVERHRRNAEEKSEC